MDYEFSPGYGRGTWHECVRLPTSACLHEKTSITGKGGSHPKRERDGHQTEFKIRNLSGTSVDISKFYLAFQTPLFEVN